MLTSLGRRRSRGKSGRDGTGKRGSNPHPSPTLRAALQPADCRDPRLPLGFDGVDWLPRPLATGLPSTVWLSPRSRLLLFL